MAIWLFLPCKSEREGKVGKIAWIDFQWTKQLAAQNSLGIKYGNIALTHTRQMSNFLVDRVVHFRLHKKCGLMEENLKQMEINDDEEEKYKMRLNKIKFKKIEKQS